MRANVQRRKDRQTKTPLISSLLKQCIQSDKQSHYINEGRALLEK